MPLPWPGRTSLALEPGSGLSFCMGPVCDCTRGRPGRPHFSPACLRQPFSLPCPRGHLPPKTRLRAAVLPHGPDSWNTFFPESGCVTLPFLGTRLACPDPRMRPWALAPALARTWRLSRPGPGGGVCYGVWTVVGIALLNMLLLPLVLRPPRCGTWGGRCQLEGPHLQFHLWPVCP